MIEAQGLGGGNQELMLEEQTEVRSLKDSNSRGTLCTYVMGGKWGPGQGAETRGWSVSVTKGQSLAAYLQYLIHISRHILILCIIHNYTH